MENGKPIEDNVDICMLLTHMHKLYSVVVIQWTIE